MEPRGRRGGGGFGEVPTKLTDTYSRRVVEMDIRGMRKKLG
ncbi:hypothetical protein ACFFF5_08865 [Lederbergia wuyishanensis]|uniref:Uncharacterized protein n=1 Tax=Lederbergia wuyishanensis TaxID=1347903 RepID=A0ABU0D621_9BACI|nr:hypothetical protein [Lederbergia wuyishanensis]MDQ0343867.1 hypothetical protein [Lederbergia wuyishanensis]